MMKVQRKISGGFRSAAGAAMFCRILGYLSTLRKQETPILSALRNTLHRPTIYAPATGLSSYGTESFWSFSKRRLLKFNGISKHTFELHLK